MIVKKLLISGISILLIIFIIFLIADGTFLRKKYAKVWSKDYIDDLDNIQHKLIAGGITASSSHNMQPWLVKIVSKNEIELYLDMTKSLKVVDKDNTQMLMSNGTFIKAYENYANKYGYDVIVNYHKPDFSADKPLVATIEITENHSIKTVDTISSSTYMISENSKIEKDIDSGMKDILEGYDGIEYEIISGSKLTELKKILLEGMVIECNDQKAVEEMIEVFRFTEWEKNKYRYGLTIKTSGVLKPVIQSISKLLASDWKGFGSQGIKMFKERLDKEHTYILIKSAKPTYKEYMFAGQIYQEMIGRLNQYNIRPASQVIEKYDAMKNINKEFETKYGKKSDVLLIIGIQDKVTKHGVKTPRHLVEDILID